MKDGKPENQYTQLVAFCEQIMKANGIRNVIGVDFNMKHGGLRFHSTVNPRWVGMAVMTEQQGKF